MSGSKAQIIALAGKGGVGKTSLSAAMVRLIVENHPGKRILAIDADPAVGLATALGVDVEGTINDLRKEIIASVDEEDLQTALELLEEAKFHILDMIREQNGFSFLAVGRPEEEGCYCKVNVCLKEAITLLSGEFDYVVIDGEAGIEQINRRVMEEVTHLFLVTDQSKKGCQVALSIRDVAGSLVKYEDLYVIVNRVTSDDLKKYMDLGDLPVAAYIASDEDVVTMDMQGRDIFTLPEDSPLIKGASEALKTISIIK